MLKSLLKIGRYPNSYKGRSLSMVDLDLTPCIICEKAIIYLEVLDLIHEHPAGASKISIRSEDQSNFDGYDYSGLICDACLDKLIQLNRVLITLSNSGVT